MKYDITYSCGHKGTVELFGKSADRENKIKWYENSAICPDCYKAKLDAERAAKNAEAAEVAKINGYPQLTGTDKQISWANTIRDNMINDLKKVPGYNEMQEAQDFVAWLIATITTASQWIEEKDFSAEKMVVKYYKVYAETK